jgi:hypothetical protein
MKIEINQKFLCIKNYIMNDERIAYFKGSIYKIKEIKDNNSFNMPSELFDHEMQFDDEFFEHFKLKENNMTPLHYSNEKDYDLIDVGIDYQLNFFRFNVLKYICRAGKKQNELQDLEKALDYIQREIDYVRKQELKQIER